jgi:hypothetical protein
VDNRKELKSLIAAAVPMHIAKTPLLVWSATLPSKPEPVLAQAAVFLATEEPAAAFEALCFFGTEIMVASERQPRSSDTGDVLYRATSTIGQNWNVGN